ncbi:MAG: DUF892 family protein [Bacteroidota bacterium]
MGPIDNLKDLMIEQLRELFDGEVHSHRKMQKLLSGVSDDRLRAVVESYAEAHDEQVMRLCQVFERQFVQKRGEISESMEVMAEEALQLLDRCSNHFVKDAAIVTELQHLIHFKIAGYGAVTSYARELKMWDEAAILHRCLETEKEVDEKLAMVARNELNRKATHADLSVK